MSGIDGDEVKLLSFFFVSLNQGILRGVGKNLLDVARFESAIFCEELHAVSVVGQMARRDHDGAVGPCLIEEDGHEHRGRGRKAAVERSDAAGKKSGEYGTLQAGSGNARVVSDGDRHFLRFFADLLFKEIYEAVRDAACGLFRQIDGLVGDAGYGNAAHVAAVLQFHPLFFRNHGNPPMVHSIFFRVYYTIFLE